MSDSAVSWAAIIAGALAAAAITVMLVVLGSALGLSIVSPFPGFGASPTTFAISTAIWLVIMQWVSSGIGGYLVGRLRTRWTGVHSDEVFFRDSAHGFLAWSLATLLVVALLTSSAATLVGGTARVAGEALSAGAQGAAAVATQAASRVDPTAYLVDTLFRPSSPEAGATTAPSDGATTAPSDGATTAPAPGATTAPSDGATTAPSDGATTAPSDGATTPPGQMTSGASESGSGGDFRAEVGRILAQGIAGDLSDEDRAYLAQVIATRTGISADEAERRVDQVVANIENTKETVQQAADDARKAAATAAGLGFLSLLVGAFIACVAAIVGGNQRDGLAPWRVRVETP